MNSAGINGPIRDTGKWMAEKLAAADSTEPEVLDDWVDMFKLNTIAPFFVIRAFKKLLVKAAEATGQAGSAPEAATPLHNVGRASEVQTREGGK